MTTTNDVTIGTLALTRDFGLTNTASHQADDAASVASAITDGSLCMALYYPPALQKDDHTCFNPIWWPAVQFSSVNSFAEAMVDVLNTQLSQATNEEHFTHKEVQKHQKRLTQRMLHESASESQYQTLYYLGRPLYEYVCAIPLKASNEVTVQDFNVGMAIDGQKLLCQPAKFPSEELYMDFHGALEKSMTKLLVDEDDEDKQLELPIGLLMKRARSALVKWKEDQEIRPAAEPPAYQQRNLEDDNDDDDSIDRQPRHIHQRQLRHPGSPAGQSVAAVSYTEDSIVSVQNHNHDTHQNAESAPKKSTVETLSPPTLLLQLDPNESFESIRHKLQLEGWEMIYDEESKQDVCRAPNGYKFPSHVMLQTHLQKSYGWIPPRPPAQPRRTNRQRGGGIKMNNIAVGAIWKYVRGCLGWTYTPKPHDIPGLDTWIYYRPSFSNKNRGRLGHDHFLNQESILEYCLAHGIHPPLTPVKETLVHERVAGCPNVLSGDEDMSANEDLDQIVEESLESHVSFSSHVGDAGYATPTGQTPSPQDPGKPLVNEEYASDGISDDEEDRYNWCNLWPALKKCGWVARNAPNMLDDWWYCKPVRSMGLLDDDQSKEPPRRPKDFIKGKDYFVSQDEVIAFCKERDNLNRKASRTIVDGRPRKRKANGNSLFKKSTTNETAKQSMHNGLTNSKKRRSCNEERIHFNSSKKQKKPRFKSFTDPDVVGASSTNRFSKERKQSRVTQRNKKVHEKPLNPEDIKVMYDGEAFARNPAPWVSKPFLIPYGTWHNCYKMMGCTYSNNNYFLPGEFDRTSDMRFANILDLQDFICQEGKYEKYMEKLDKTSRPIVQRHFDYVNVPGNPSLWEKYRYLSIEEVIVFLNLLGFEIGTDGIWLVPDGIPLLEGNKYKTLKALGKDLIRVPDLEDRCRGESKRRKARKSDRILNEDQYIALRLRIAEGLEGLQPDLHGKSIEVTNAMTHDFGETQKYAAFRPKSMSVVNLPAVAPRCFALKGNERYATMAVRDQNRSVVSEKHMARSTCSKKSRVPDMRQSFSRKLHDVVVEAESSKVLDVEEIEVHGGNDMATVVPNNVVFDALNSQSFEEIRVISSHLDDKSAVGSAADREHFKCNDIDTPDNKVSTLQFRKERLSVVDNEIDDIKSVSLSVVAENPIISRVIGSDKKELQLASVKLHEKISTKIMDQEYLTERREAHAFFDNSTDRSSVSSHLSSNEATTNGHSEPNTSSLQYREKLRDDELCRGDTESSSSRSLFHEEIPLATQPEYDCPHVFETLAEPLPSHVRKPQQHHARQRQQQFSPQSDGDVLPLRDDVPARNASQANFFGRIFYQFRHE